MDSAINQGSARIPRVADRLLATGRARIAHFIYPGRTTSLVVLPFSIRSGLGLVLLQGF